MAITGWGANHLLHAGLVVSDYPFAIDGWCHVPSYSDSQFVNVTNSDQTAVRGRATYLAANTFSSEVYVSSGPTSYLASVASPPLNTWVYFTSTFISTILREAYINAGSRGTNTSTLDPGAADRVMIGEWSDSNIGLGEIAIWNLGAMTQGQRETVWSKRYNGGSGGNGANPLAIDAEPGQPHTGSLVAYWRLSNTSDLSDRAGNGHNLSIVGSLSTWAGAAPPVDAEPSTTPQPSYVLGYRLF